MAQSQQGSSSKGDVFLGSSPPPGKPKGLLDAISEIQQYYVVERSGSTIPDDFLTMKGKIGFFEVGFKGAFISGLVSALLTPIAIGVMEKYLPIFGSTNPSLYDKAFALLLAVSFSIGYAVFISTVGKYYIGGISKAAINNMMAGFIIGALFKLFVAFILFHFIYFVILDPDKLARILLGFKFVLKYNTLNSIYQWLINFRPVFLTSAYLVVATTLLLIIIPVGSIIVQSRRTKRIMEMEKTWE
ncbi:MAG: hypothetical protein QXQ02_09285 [Halobacteria archaeon]